jgi:hypothetical protein
MTYVNKINYPQTPTTLPLLTRLRSFGGRLRWFITVIGGGVRGARPLSAQGDLKGARPLSF